MAKHEEHEEHVNHEAWVIPYADMLTLLFCMFLALWALASQSNRELSKYIDLAGRISSGFSGQTQKTSAVDGSGESIIEGAPSVGTVQQSADDAKAAQQALQNEKAAQQQEQQDRSDLEAIQKNIAEVATSRGLGAKVNFRSEARGLVVTIVTDQVLFSPGSASFTPGGAEVLRAVDDAIEGTSNSIVIEGHTDNTPISGTFASNWELSTARATSVLRYMVDSLGFPAGRVSASGYADQRPIASNSTPEGRSQNRRVEMVVLTRAAAKATGS